MKKKRRVPAPERNAFESARAALERAGEDPSEIKKPVGDDAETSGDGAETPAPVSATMGGAEASAPEAVEQAEASDAEPPAESAEASVEEPPTQELETSDEETTEEPEASDEAPLTDGEPSADGAEASGEEAPTQEPETSDEETTPQEPEASDEEPTDGAEASGEEAPTEEEDDWDGGTDEDSAETERHMMETKEITVGYHRVKAEAPKEPKEHKKKSRFKAPNLNRFKDALRGNAERNEPQDNNISPPSGSSRDAALKNRVMRITDDETRNYLLDRVLPQMTWYSKKSAQYQTAYYRFMAVSIGLGALIPVCSIGGSHIFFKVAIALLGASVTAINAYLALHKYQELWVSYRSAREDLIHTLYSYFNKADVFAQKNMTEQELNVLLVEVCENALSKENGGWTTTVLQKT